jgi:hypothetical protein
MVNFYRRFLPNCAQVLHPLTDLLKGGSWTLQWTTTAQESFQKVKRLLAAAVLLQHPSPTTELPLPLMPPIPISEALCCKNQATMGGPLDFSPKN